MKEDVRSKIDRVINEEKELEFRKKLEEDTKKNAGDDYYLLFEVYRTLHKMYFDIHSKRLP